MPVPARRTNTVAVFAVHALVFLLLLWWSWRKWPDPITDFGRELYVPWQLTRGKVLYRDVASLFGPLSPYVNALWMRLFGVSLMTIAMCNAAILAAIIAAIHHFIRVATDRFTATVASLTALALCGFTQYLDVGNYNFITPYSHEATHGFALAVVTLILLHRAMVVSQPMLAAAAGFSFGLSLLTKTEAPVALMFAIAVGVIGYASLGRGARRGTAAMTAAFCMASAVGPALFFAYFASSVGAAQAIRSVASAWLVAFNPAVVTNRFYQFEMGFDHPARNAAVVAALFVFVLAAVGGAVALVSTTPSRKRSRAGEVKHVALVLMLAAVPFTQLLPLGRTLPLVTLAALAAASALFYRDRGDRQRAFSHLAVMMWCAFAAAMLGKMLLRAQIFHYGFYLALPAVTVVVIALCAIIPSLLERWRPGRAALEFRWLAVFAVAGAALPNLAISNNWYATKDVPIGSGGDRFYISNVSRVPSLRQGLLLRDAIQALTGMVNANDTIAVLPEGVMVNYLLRLDSPLRVVTVMPPELLTFGEDTITDSLKAGAPEFVVFVHKTTAEYGYPLFGTDTRYGAATMAWVRAHYRPTMTIGDEPATAKGNGIEIFRLSSLSSAHQ